MLTKEARFSLDEVRRMDFEQLMFWMRSLYEYNKKLNEEVNRNGTS
ncbi:MAG: hypothetical protein PHE67_02670 [Campylobacterales bacterium]|nr:hypothetical protein [Campylobacterales bacterium]